LEVREALRLRKRILLLHEEDPRHHAVDFQAERESAPEDLKHLFDEYESLAWRRRRHELQATMTELLQRAGGAYAHLRSSAESTLMTEVRTRNRKQSAVRTDGVWFDHLFWFRVTAAVATFIASIFAAQSFRATVGEHSSGAHEPAP
jgi:hypothetical protein